MAVPPTKVPDEGNEVRSLSVHTKAKEGKKHSKFNRGQLLSLSRQVRGGY